MIAKADRPATVPNWELSAKEVKARRARWTRRYKTLADWMMAHPGEACGGLVGPTLGPIRYYYLPLPNCLTALQAHKTAPKDATELTREEYLEALGIAPYKPGTVAQPTWPPTPEVWAQPRKPRANGKPKTPQTRAEAMVAIVLLMAAHGITSADLGAKIVEA